MKTDVFYGFLIKKPPANLKQVAKMFLRANIFASVLIESLLARAFSFI